MLENIDFTQIKLFISIVSIGLFGGIGHCGFMCGPFVMMQVNNNLKEVKINDMNYMARLKAAALIPYHLGRITTYSIMGFLCSVFGKNIKNTKDAHIISGVMLLIAALFVAGIILKNFKINLKPKFFRKVKIGFFAKFLNLITKFINPLFVNPRGFNGYLLGLVLGLIPCGLLYSVLIISANFENSYLAFLAMAMFGVATIPSLFIASFTSYFLFERAKNYLTQISQFILLINMISLFIIASSQLKII